ncbi:MAG TPA: MoaD/ThiS family protein [Myxococcales bacterium]|jgi:molybdopterin converting factor small subunit
MRVHVKVLGALSKPFGKDDFEHEITERSCLEDLLKALGYHPSHLRFIVASVNGSQQKLGYALQDKDEVALVLPTSGG